MKKLSVLLAIFSVILFSCQKNEKAESKFTVDPNPVIQNAIQNKKYVMVIFESETCQYCEKLNKEVLSNPDVKQALLKNNIEIAIVNVYGNRKVIDPEGKKEMTESSLAGLYNVTGFPTISIFDPNKNYQLLYQIPGYIPKEMFISLADYIGSGCYQKVKFNEFTDKKSC